MGFAQGFQLGQTQVIMSSHLVSCLGRVNGQFNVMRLAFRSWKDPLP